MGGGGIVLGSETLMLISMVVIAEVSTLEGGLLGIGAETEGLSAGAVTVIVTIVVTGGRLVQSTSLDEAGTEIVELTVVVEVLGLEVSAEI